MFCNIKLIDVIIHSIAWDCHQLCRLLTEKEDSIMKMSVLNLDVNAENKKKRSCCSK